MSGRELSLGPGVVLHETYVLESALGRGGMGAVWRARHARLPRPIAIKVLHDHAYESEELLLRFRREAEITSQLGHPHIVEVFDFNVLDDGRAYLVMELLEGQSLRDRLREGPPLSLADALVVLEQVASALAHAHRAGVVHRDLKPENVFLVGPPGGRPHAKVLDFGISKMQGAHTVITQGASLMGTPRYMSPEQARGDTADVDGRADQFSLGAIAYEILSGQPAFRGESVTQVLLRVLEEEPTPLESLAPGVPPPVVTAVRRALAKDREARFPDLDRFRVALTGGDDTTDRDPVPYGARPGSHAATDPDAVDDTVRRPSAPVPTGGAGAGGAGAGGAGTAGGGRWVGPVAVVLLVGLGAGAWWGFGYSFRAGSGSTATADAGRGTATGDARRGTATGAPAGAAAPDAGLAAGGSTAGQLGSTPDAGASARDADAPAERPDAAVESTRRRRPVRPKPLPPRLIGAEAALRASHWDEAIRRADRSLREEGDQRAHAVAAIAYCGKRDLANANARLRQTPSRSRGRVRRACRRFGFELAP